MNNTIKQGISFKNKKVIIFDLDGTIVRLTADWMSLKEILVIKYKEIYEENRDFESISACLSKIVELKDRQVLEDFFNIIKQFEFKNIKNNEPIEETIFFLKKCKLFGVIKGAKFAILSLNMRNTIVESLKLVGVYEKFDFIVGREDVSSWKPAPEGLIRIKNHFRIGKDKMIYFGDLEKDIMTGKNAGVEAYLIDDLINLVNIKRK